MTLCPLPIFKGTVPRDFQLLAFFMDQFPPSPWAPEYTIRADSNFFKNSRRYSQQYSQLKVHHRCCWHQWQMEKIFNQKNFIFFVWTPLGSRANIYIHFCLQVHFKVSSAWYCSHYLPPMLLTPAANLPPVLLTPVAYWPPASTTPVVPVVHLDLWISLQIFEKKWPYYYFQELGGSWFMKKTWSKKSCDTVPLRGKETFEMSSVYCIIHFLWMV